MSSRTILSRPRTRIYDSNYNIGESYYKGAIDHLDRKYYGRTSIPISQNSTTTAAADIAERHARYFADDDLETSRRRAEKHISSPGLFDSRGARIGSASVFENDFDAETTSSLKRIRANKKVSIVDDVDLETTSNNLRTHRLLDRSEKILNSVGLTGNDMEDARRSINDELSYKRRSKSSYDAEADNLTKWTPVAVSEDRESAASIRARQSKARIDDIDEEMAAMAEKQAAREKRVARLKQLVAECGEDSFDEASSSVQSVSVSATKEKKTVRF